LYNVFPNNSEYANNQSVKNQKKSQNSFLPSLQKQGSFRGETPQPINQFYNGSAGGPGQSPNVLNAMIQAGT